MTNEHQDGIPEDLEDGEIETDDESELQNPTTENNVEDKPLRDGNGPVPKDNEDSYRREKGKKKKNKSNKKNEKNKDKERHRRYRSPSPKEDFAENVEKAIRRALKKDEASECENKNEQQKNNERKKGKKRRKEHKDKESNKKRRKHSDEDDVDESEMMFVRGASPTKQISSPPLEPPESSHSSYESDGSNDSRTLRDRQRRPKRKKKFTRRREPHPMQDPEGVCLYYMQGQCQDSDCPFSHDAELPRKYELCKFYLMKCCAKGDNCLYMHSDFPCKFYHTGLPCVLKDECKFAHGKPLGENLKQILLKHIETAPKEILGDFPRMTRESAAMMMKNAQNRLMQQYNMIPPPEKEPAIPSIFDLNVTKPVGFEDNHNKNSNKHSKSRQSRWQNEHQSMNAHILPNNIIPRPQNVLSINNLNGVLTPKQITDLQNLGIEDLSQLSQLTVIQLNSLGLNLKQIHDIQLNTMSIQKLGLIETDPSPPTSQAMTGPKDLDLRVPPVVPTVAAVPVPANTEMGRDVDMRFAPIEPKILNENNEKPIELNTKLNKDAIDIDQYRKDALKYIGKEKTDKDADTLKKEKEEKTTEVKDVDHRVLPPYNNETNNTNFNTAENTMFTPSSDTDIRFLAPDTTFPKKIDKKHRQSTTDDEDNNLLIDEKWYSSDDEKTKEKDRKSDSPKDTSQRPSSPPEIETKAILSKLGDLSKIDISDEVSKLINSMKNNLQDKPEPAKEPESKAIETKPPETKPRDPRSLAKKSSVHKSPMNDFSKGDVLKSPPQIQKKSSRVSIYSCIDGATNARRRSDVDLRPKNDQDFRMPNLADTDLRQTPGGGDIDFRLALPFKPIANYTPATEINGSINSHPIIPYKLKIVFIPRPDYTEIKNTTAKSQALADPRLRKVFRLSTEEAVSDGEKPATKPAIVRADPRADPRRKPKETIESLETNKPVNSLDLQVVIQNSPWYIELSTNQKILVNQHLATITSQIKLFHQDKNPAKKFDLSIVTSNSFLAGVFNNLGIILNEDGEFSYMPENMLKQQRNFQANPDMMNMPSMENRMNNMNMPPMRMSNMPMHQFNANFSNTGPRNAPGLLGIAPNMPFPERFGPPVNNGNFNNFGPNNNFGGMPFNGHPNEFNDMDSRNMGRGFHHSGRGDRWGRGGNRRNW